MAGNAPTPHTQELGLRWSIAPEMLPHHIQTGAVPVVLMGCNEAAIAQPQFTPAADGDRGFPGQGRFPVQGPIGANAIALPLNAVQLHPTVEKPGLDQANHCLIPLHASKLRHRIFEIHVLLVQTVGLILGKPSIIRLQTFDNIHF